MLDIVQIQNGLDLGVADSDIPKAANVLSVQLGALEYQSDFGLDKKYFLMNGIEFQLMSYQAYCVRRLVESEINVTEVSQLLERLFGKITFRIGNKNQNVRGLIR